MKVFFHYSLYGFSNVYLVGNDDTRDALVIDPAEITANLVSFIEHNGYRVRAALATHNHAHHVRGLSTLLKIWDADVYASGATVEGVATRRISDGERLSICGLDVEAISVPGHSSDSLCFKIGRIIFSGDVLSAGLIGSTLSSYGYRLLTESIRAKLFRLSDDHIVFPGHGPPTTIGAEKTHNIGMDMGFEATEGAYDFFL
jgi:glyoxylase-like metal-dependent hydrolase (beta-lactamase superfamily II)